MTPNARLSVIKTLGGSDCDPPNRRHVSRLRPALQPRLIYPLVLALNCVISTVVLEARIARMTTQATR